MDLGSRSLVGVIGLLVAGCFAPNRAPLGDEGDTEPATSSSTGDGPATSSGPESGTSSSGANPQDTSSTANPDPGDTGSSDTSDGSSSTGSDFVPSCGDGEAGPGEFCFEPGDVFEHQDFGFALAIGDVDGDGFADVLHVIQDEALVSLGDGAGGLTDPLTLSVDGVGTLPGQAGSTIADFDGDGALDIVVAESAEMAGSRLRAAYTDGLELQFGTTEVDVEVPEPYAFVALASGPTLGGDGPGVVAVADGAMSVFPVTSDGVGAAVDTSFVLPGATLLAVGNLNNDGHDDVLLGSTGGDGVSPIVRRFFGSASGALVQHPTSLLEELGVSGDGLSAMASGDFDGDSNPDIVLAVANALVVGFGDGVVGFSSVETLSSPAAVFALHTADLDGDGTDELIVTESGIRVLADLASGGETVFEYEPAWGDVGLVATGDLNGDAVPDIALGDRRFNGEALVLFSNP